MKAPCIAVAYSGGRDSTALLHATLSAVVNAAAPHSVRVLALHVHHGLSPQADDWVRHAQQQCERWAARGWPVELHVHRVSDSPAAGSSVEAWARERRYEALTRMATEHGAEVVFLAHHRRDQAETFLLQALRGGGPSGLAGMPRSVERHGVKWVRPWLGWSREAIESYVEAHGLSFVDDASNGDLRFARNRLRSGVWPALSAAFPHAEMTLARSAVWAHQAAVCLDELAGLDLAVVAGPTGLNIAAWQRLSAARRGNVLRAWLRANGQAVSASLVLRLSEELPAATLGQWEVPGGLLRRHRQKLCFVARGDAAKVKATSTETDRQTVVRITRAGRYLFRDWDGCLTVRRVERDGVPLAGLSDAVLRARSGGESFQAGPGRPSRSLKRQFQVAGVPSWQRDAPLLFSGGQLVFVPGLGIDARVIGLPGQALVTLAWERLSDLREPAGQALADGEPIDSKAQ